MSNVLRIAMVDPVDSTRAGLKTLLMGIDVVWLEAECSRYEFFGDVVTQTQPDVALISLDANPQKGLELVAKVSQDLPACQTMVISSSQEGSLILQAMRNGAKEFLSAPLKLDDFLAAMERLQQALGVRQGDGPARTSQVISICGVSGGVGCTSLAINLGCALAQQPGASVVIIDLDVALGDADVWLDIIPDYTIRDVADNITRLDYALLKRSLTKHTSGAYLLPRPVDMEENSPLGPDELRRVIALLKATFTYLVIDLSKSFTPLDIAAMDASNVVLMVTQLDLPSLRNAVRVSQFFQRRDGYREKLKIVVNRMGLDENQISLNKALETLGSEIFHTLPNDYATMVESRNNGVPLIAQAPKSKLTRSVQQLGAMLDQRGETGEEKTEAKKQKSKGLFSFLSAGK